MNRDICYGEAFEERIANLLEQNGHTVYRSVYATYGKQTSQIDLVLFDKSMPICIECKAIDASRVIYKRSHNQWMYIDIKGNTRYINNPLKQVKRHADNLFMNMVNDIEASLPWEMTIPSARQAVVIKGHISDYLSENIFTEKESSIQKFLEYCNENWELPSIQVEAMHKWLQEHSDTSKERLEEHIKYLNDCKKNKTGAFSPEQ
ncbi:MAG: NERD domain-containing protein [Lachnospiraceae bacterium]|nr:NERD domain-containing protein [Lachnospiraceae bacterium]MCM1259304.1 NERD domain-containing protein [Roseburia sp.]